MPEQAIERMFGPVERTESRYVPGANRTQAGWKRSFAQDAKGMAMNDRIKQLAWEARDALALHRWARYCQAAGAHTSDWLESWYLSEEQQDFFMQYESQLDPLLYALASVVGTED
jgi:hypothetical protein